MAVRTISRDRVNPRVVLVWPKGVMEDDVRINDDGADYAKLDGAVVQPATINADVFKAAFGFVPLSGSVDRYLIRQAHAPETTEAKLTSAIKALVQEVMDD